MPVAVRPMVAGDLAAVDVVYRLAFGSFLGLADPPSYRGGSGVIRTRFAGDPAAGFVPEEDGRIVGSVSAMDWGSLGVLGPLVVHPDAWGRGIVRLLVSPVLALFAARGMRLAALFTHPQSPKHLRLYESFGFEIGFITAVMEKAVAVERGEAAPLELLSALGAEAWQQAVLGCRALANSLYDGLDLGREIRALASQRFGDCLLLRAGDAVAGFALCHMGAGTEAGPGTLYVKFAAVRPGAGEDFAALLAASERLAAARGLRRIVAGVNSGRCSAYRLMRACGYRACLVGVAMHRPDVPAYGRPEAFAGGGLRCGGGGIT